MSGSTDLYGVTGPAMAVEGAPKLTSRISWGAVIAGAVIALAVGATLNMLGAGIGATMVDAAARDTPDASSFGIAGGIWLLVSNLIALGVGAYAAARLSGTADGADGSLHGIAVWATTTLVSAALLGNLLAGIASTAASGAADMLGGAAQGVGSVASAAGNQAAERTDNATLQSVTQSAISRGQEALTAPTGDPAQMTPDQRKAQIGSLVGRRVTNGALPQADADRLTALVAAEAGISPEEARSRIQQVEQQAQQTVREAEEKARQAADAAAKAAATGAFWAFGAMLLGAITAVIGARIGTRAAIRTGDFARRPLR
jgi:hypothetical protein